MNHARNSRIFRLALAASAIILIGGAAKAFAATPEAKPAPQQVAMQGDAMAPKKVRVLAIHGHDNCAHVEIRRPTNGAASEARCLRKF